MDTPAPAGVSRFLTGYCLQGTPTHDFGMIAANRLPDTERSAPPARRTRWR